MSTFESLFKNQFLVAMPSLLDDNFHRSVALVCEHNAEGAIGIVINRPTDMPLTEMLDQMGIDHDQISDASACVYWGGPVQPERGFVIHRAPGEWDSTMKINEDLFITTSRDVLRAIGTGESPSDYIVALGYAGWGAGQLEEEMLKNAWLNTPIDQQILFTTRPAKRWAAATQLLGVSVTQLSAESGRA